MLLLRLFAHFHEALIGGLKPVGIADAVQEQFPHIKPKHWTTQEMKVLGEGWASRLPGWRNE